jgi:hypothetical protein
MEISWTYPLQGIAFNWIHQRQDDDNQMRTIECVCGERIEQQVEFELDRARFSLNDRHSKSKTFAEQHHCSSITCFHIHSMTRSCQVKRNPTAIESYAIVDEQNVNQDFIQNAVGIQLLKRDNQRIDVARFNIIFSPTKLIT